MVMRAIRELGLGLFILLSPSFVVRADQVRELWKFGCHTPDGHKFVESAEYFGHQSDFPDITPYYFPTNFIAGPIADITFHAGTNRPVGTKFKIGYYRGAYFSGVDSTPGGLRDMVVSNMVSIFSSEDSSKLVVAMDYGPVYSSTNSGRAWTVYDAPGTYAFPLATAADGSGFYAEVWLPPIHPWFLSHCSPSADKPPRVDWYIHDTPQPAISPATIPSSSNALPVLYISPSDSGILISWDASCTNCVLQQNAGLESTIWTDVSEPVLRTNGRNQVLIPQLDDLSFYRLRPR